MDHSTRGISLQEINFPVFKIGIHKPEEDSGLVFYYHERTEHTDSGNHTELKYKVIDDKNIDLPTLAKRRLKLMQEDVPLVKLTNAIYFLGDLIKLADAKVWFIDSLGKVFNYKKSTVAKLKFHEIETVIPINTGGVIVQVKNISQRFKSLYKPELDKTHVGILHFGMSMILYGFYDKAHKETWRRV